MALPKITFTKGSGGLNRRNPGNDHVSCLYFIGVAPTSWSGALYKQVNSLADAEAVDVVDSLTYGKYHYHIAEFFRMAPGAKLYIAFATDETKLFDLQRAVNGEIRQFVVDMSTVAFNINKITGLQAYADTMLVNMMPASIITTFDFTVTALSALPVIVPSADCPNVSVMIGCSKSGPGATHSMPALGTILGAIAAAAVHESILWVEKFNVADPVSGQLQEIAFPNGDLVHNTTEALLEELETKRYIFFRSYPMTAGSYFNNSHTCTALASDYAFIENERTIDKAIREIYLRVLPQTGRPVYVDPATGKLTPEMCSYFESLANDALEQMESDRELSGYAAFVDPDQNVLTSSTINFVIKNVPVGVARTFSMKISFTTSI